MEKTKEERVKEGITILKKLKQVGIDTEDSGSIRIKKAISDWVNTGEEYVGVIPFAKYDRDAYITLPKYNTSNANAVLKIIDPSLYD